MTTPAFPLPDAKIEQANYSEGLLMDPTIRSSQDSGEPRARPRFSAVIKTYSGQIFALFSEDCDTLFDFYDEDCAFGSLPFTWVHPRTGEAGTFKWQKRPEITGTNGRLFIMSISVMQLP